jgi:hypothetical protein
MSISDDIRAAAASLGGGEKDGESTGLVADGVEGGVSARDGETTSAEPSPPAVEAVVDAEREPERPVARLDGRDDKGRFAPKAAQKEGEEPKPVAKTAAPTPPPATQTESRAPQSWGPAVREHWGKLPAEVQQAIMKRETDMARGLQEAAPARKLAESFNQTLAPYRHMMQGEPMQVVGSLLQTAAALQTAPPEHKAQILARMVKGYGVPIETLATALDAPDAGPQATQAPPQYRDPRVDQIMAYVQQRQVAQQQKLATDVQEFAKSHEFFDDVREDMADIHDMMVKRGLTPSLEDLYSRAVAMHPEISGVMKQREAAKQANAARASTQRAREAGSLSVKSQPAAAPPPPRKAGSVMDDLMAARERLAE